MKRRRLGCLAFQHHNGGSDNVLLHPDTTIPYQSIPRPLQRRPTQSQTPVYCAARCKRLFLIFALVNVSNIGMVRKSVNLCLNTGTLLFSIVCIAKSTAFQSSKIVYYHHVQPLLTLDHNHIFVMSKKSPIRNTATSLNVLTVPIEQIIEEASTKVPSLFLDDLIDESVRTTARQPVIAQLTRTDSLGNADDWSLWKRWKGTVFAQTWDSCLFKMLYSAIIYSVLHYVFGPQSAPPPATTSFISAMSKPTMTSASVFSGLNVIYGQVLLPITTFTLTFFVDQAYRTWRKCLSLSRQLQGKVHDLSMLLASHAARETACIDPISGHENSTYTEGSSQLLELISRYLRIFNLFAHASFTRSHRPLVTPRGMRRLVERGLLTEQEREILTTSEVPATQFQTAVLLWIFRLYLEGCSAGHFIASSTVRGNSQVKDPSAIEHQFMELIYDSRISCGAIGSTLNGRMPLAYTHIVQVLVDIILWSYPILAYSIGMSGFLCVVGTGLLTIGYRGLFDLSKRFLDPYDNENFGKGEDPFIVDTFIAETNLGSVRWMNGLDKFHISTQSIQNGNLTDHILPLSGYSIEEAFELERIYY